MIWWCRWKFDFWFTIYTVEQFKTTFFSWRDNYIYIKLIRKYKWPMNKFKNKGHNNFWFDKDHLRLTEKKCHYIKTLEATSRVNKYLVYTIKKFLFAGPNIGGGPCSFVLLSIVVLLTPGDTILAQQAIIISCAQFHSIFPYRQCLSVQGEILYKCFQFKAIIVSLLSKQLLSN